MCGGENCQEVAVYICLFGGTVGIPTAADVIQE